MARKSKFKEEHSQTADHWRDKECAYKVVAQLLKFPTRALQGESLALECPCYNFR